MSANFTIPISAAWFTAEKFAKADLFCGNSLFVGLNCFEPGQVQSPHTHAAADKFYYVISGRARIVVGDESQVVEAGALVWAPADVEHGVLEVMERTIMLVGIAPPPRAVGSAGASTP